MKQKKLQTVADLIDGTRKAKAGAIAHTDLGLVVGSADLIEGALNPLLLATNAHRSAIHHWRTLATTLTAKVKIAYDLAYVVRDSLKPTLGRQYSSAWEGTGFERSLKIPRAVAPLQDLLRGLKNYLTGKPTLEIENVSTAALVGTALDALQEARTAVTVQTGAVKTLLAARRQKEKALRMRLSGTVEELKRVIGPIDGRWEAFGLNQPGIKQRPETPTAPTVKAIEGNALAVEWERAPRAQHYRVWMKIAGVHSEPVPVGSPSDLDFTIEDVPSQAVVEVGVSAVNSGGESAVSDWLTVMMT